MEDNKNLERDILDAAEQLFLEKGFALSTTTEIARRVGCNQALVHYYYRTKEQLFNSIFEKKVEQFASVFFSIEKENLTFKEKLRLKIGAHFDILAANRRIPFMIINEIGVNEERFLKALMSVGKIPDVIFQSIKEALNKEIENGVIRPITVNHLLLNILSLNVMSFLTLPAYVKLMKFDEAQVETYLKERREEVINTIINSLYI